MEDGTIENFVSYLIILVDDFLCCTNNKPMKTVMHIFGFLVIISGLFLIIVPNSIFQIVEANSSSLGFYILAIVIRLVLGALFLITAKTSKFPRAFSFLGIIAIMAAVFFIVIGQEGFQDMVAQILHGTMPFARAAGVIVLLFGAFIIYALKSTHSEASKNLIDS